MSEKPKIWGILDIPTPAEMEAYLARIRAARSAFSGVAGAPEIPGDMGHLTVEAANDIERALLWAHETIGRMEISRVYSGELQAGGF